MPTFRLLACLLLACVGLGAWAGAAQAEEIFILDNGEALRGHVVRQDDEAVRLRLVGVMGDATVDIPRARIKRRFVSVDAAHRPAREDPTDWMAKARRVELPTGEEDPGPGQPAFTLPEEEPSVGNEGFFQRLARVAVLALPPDHAGRTIIGLLFFAALLVLVLLGGRIAEIDEMGLGRATVLALLLGTILVDRRVVPRGGPARRSCRVDPAHPGRPVARRRHGAAARRTRPHDPALRVRALRRVGGRVLGRRDPRLVLRIATSPA